MKSQEGSMKDWAAGIEARNYAIRHRTDSRNLSDMLRVLGSILAIAGLLFFYSWVQNQMVSLGYEIQSLQAREAELLRAQRSLALEEETLKNPERIDLIARHDLNMMPLRPSQVLAPQYQDIEFAGGTALAMATPPRSSLEPRRGTATN
jgi:cell division protein FtsL